MSDETNSSAGKFPTPPTDPGSDPVSPITPDLLSKLESASDRAINAMGSAAPKRKPGQRGPDKKPRARKSVPVGDVGSSTPEALFETIETGGDPSPWAVSAPGLDDETAEALAVVIFEIFKDGRENFWKLKVFSLTGSKELADAFISPISPKLESAMQKSAKALVLKYGAQIEYAPELTFFGAGAVVIVSDFLRFRALRADASKFNRPAA